MAFAPTLGFSLNNLSSGVAGHSMSEMYNEVKSGLELLTSMSMLLFSAVVLKSLFVRTTVTDAFNASVNGPVNLR